MSTYTEIQAAIQGLADAESNQIRIAIGTPGGHLQNPLEEWRPTGSIWSLGPNAQALIVEGVASWLAASGLNSTLKAKINELVGAYNQLRTDYNNGTVPTSAPAVLPIP